MIGTKIDRYISQVFLGYFLGALLVFVTIFLSVDALSTIVYYQDVLPRSLMAFYAYYLPEIVYRMIPVAAVISTVFTLSSINKSNELVALYSIGFSLFRVASPIVFWVVMLCFANLFISDRVMPNFTKMKNYVFYHEIKKNPSMFSVVKNERIWYRVRDKIFNIKTLNEKTNTAQGLTLYYFSEDWDLIQMITAENVVIKDSQWELNAGSVTIFTGDSSFPQTSDFKIKSLPMDKDTQDLASSGNTADMLSIGELFRFIKTNREAGLDTVRYEVDFHSKFGFALAPLIMSLLGIPFSIGRSRSGGLMLNLSICLGLILLYWVTYSSSITLGNYGQIPPVLAAWTPNFLNFLLAAYFIRKKTLA